MKKAPNQCSMHHNLAAILASNHAYERVADFLRAEHFAQPVRIDLLPVKGERVTSVLAKVRRRDVQ